MAAEGGSGDVRGGVEAGVHVDVLVDSGSGNLLGLAPGGCSTLGMLETEKK